MDWNLSVLSVSLSEENCKLDFDERYPIVNEYIHYKDTTGYFSIFSIYQEAQINQIHEQEMMMTYLLLKLLMHPKWK